MKLSARGIVVLVASIGAFVFAGSELQAQEGLYEYAPMKSEEWNSVYRLNTATGELTYCYWSKVEGKDIGKTECMPVGENAGPQRPGAYSLVTSNYKGNTDVYRVDRLNGKVWSCFPLNGKVVCAPPAP